MAKLTILITLSLWGSLVIAAPRLHGDGVLNPPAVSTTTPDPSACASIAAITDSILGESPQATPTFPAQIAYDCLRTVPNKPGPAQKLIKSLKTFVQWQSTLAFLKKPPKSYYFPGVDILGELDKISSAAAAGGYESEYHFGLAIHDLISSAHDGHFLYQPDVLGGFYFANALISNLTTVSVDGVQVPKVYYYSKLSDCV